MTQLDSAVAVTIDAMKVSLLKQQIADSGLDKAGNELADVLMQLESATDALPPEMEVLTVPILSIGQDAFGADLVIVATDVRNYTEGKRVAVNGRFHSLVSVEYDFKSDQTLLRFPTGTITTADPTDVVGLSYEVPKAVIDQGEAASPGLLSRLVSLIWSF